MNITSLEIAQATMDMFFCLFCLIIFVSIKANNPKQKSMRMFVRLLLIATVLFFGETLAYIFRGNLGLFNILVTRIANLMVFAMNIAMANIWYKDYLDSGKRYTVNVDTDENNNWSLSVFINYGIFDTNGDILGVCGVGVDMNDLVDMLARYEEEYNIKVYLVNHDGLIQVDTDVSSIETGYLDNAVKTFDYLTENFQGNLISELSVSKGVVVCSEHIELNFEEIKAMADKLMYADKDEYYRRTGKDRRRV